MGILDTFNGLVTGIGGAFTRRSVAPTAAAGASGTAHTGGFIISKEKSPGLVGEQRYITFSDLVANIAIVSAGVRYYLSAISRPSWKFEPADDSAKAKEYAEKCEKATTKMVTPWFRVIRRAGMHRFYGFSLQEWRAKEKPDKDGFVGMADIEIRPQRTIYRWDFDHTGTVYGVTQRTDWNSGELYIPRNKLIYCVDDALDDGPEGLGIFRHLVESSTRMREYLRLETRGFQTDLRGIPVVRAPLAELDAAVKAQTITAQDKANIIAGIDSFITSHFRNESTGFRIDSAVYSTVNEAQAPSSVPKFALELLTGDGSAFQEVFQAINREMANLARLLNVEHLLLGADNRGAFNLSEDKSDNFAAVVESSLAEVRTTIDQDFVAPLGLMNGWDEDLWPKAKTDSSATRKVTDLITAVKDLESAGLAPDDEAHDVLRDSLGLPHRPEMDMDAMLGNGGIDPLTGEPFPVIGPDGKPLPPQPGAIPRAGGKKPQGKEPGGTGKPVEAEPREEE